MADADHITGVDESFDDARIRLFARQVHRRAARLRVPLREDLAEDAGVAQTAQDVDQLQRDRGLRLGDGDGQVKRRVAVPVQSFKTVVRGREELFDLAHVEGFHGVVHFQGGGE